MNTGHKQGPGLCSCLLFLIIVGVAGFFLLGGVSLAPRQAPLPQTPQGGGNDPLVDPGFGEPAQRVETHPDASDWSMEGVDAVPSQQPGRDSNVGNKSKRSESGDWAMEEVGGSRNDPDQKRSVPANNPDSKSTRQGDWGMEEVGGKKRK